MRRFAIVLGVIVSVCSATGVSGAEEDKRTPLEKYQGAVFMGRTMCGITFKMAQMQADLPESAREPEKSDYRGCIAKYKGEMKAAYNVAAARVKKNAARTALKEHYIAALSTLDAIVPKTGEVKLIYGRRQADNEARLDELWNRFEAEQ